MHDYYSAAESPRERMAISLCISLPLDFDGAFSFSIRITSRLSFRPSVIFVLYKDVDDDNGNSGGGRGWKDTINIHYTYAHIYVISNAS